VTVERIEEMGNIFGEQKTLKQVIREQKRNVDRSVRQLEREKVGLQRQEAKLIQDIKKAAQSNQMGSVKIMAKDLVRIRKHQTKFVNLTAQLRAVALQMSTTASTQALTESMRKVSRAMAALNGTINLPHLQKIMMEFAKQSEQMDMKSEMVGDAVEDVMDNAEDEEESEQVVSQVLDEIGVDLGEKLVDAGAKKLKDDKKVEVKEDADKKLEERLNNLGKE